MDPESRPAPDSTGRRQFLAGNAAAIAAFAAAPGRDVPSHPHDVLPGAVVPPVPRGAV